MNAVSWVHVEQDEAGSDNGAQLHFIHLAEKMETALVNSKIQVGSQDGWKLLQSQVEPIIGMTSDHPVEAGGVRGCIPICPCIRGGGTEGKEVPISGTVLASGRGPV